MITDAQISEAMRKLRIGFRIETTEDLVREMTNRFLSWKLPKDFHPDAGISFKAEYNVEYMATLEKAPSRHEPLGTNLFDYEQAAEMVRHMLGKEVK